jgi:hypothetical protein
MTIIIQDTTGFVPSGDAQALQSESWPFDVHLLVENALSFDALETDAHNSVTAGNVVVIAIDPGHHKIATRFGSATGVKPGDFDSIAKAGNAHLRAGEVKAGIEAILYRAKASRESTTALSQSSTPVVLREGLSVEVWLLIVLLVCGFAGLAVWLWRRERKQRAVFQAVLSETRAEAAELRSRNIEEAAWSDKVRSTTPTPSASASRPKASSSSTSSSNRSTTKGPRTSLTPGQAQVIVQNVTPVPQSDRFVEGMLVGDLLNRQTPVERVVERDVVRERPSRSSRDNSGADSSWSGSSSSYDSPSTSSSDSGGSSSSWDSGSGGSFDSGSSGGGFDSGGGSSDF